MSLVPSPGLAIPADLDGAILLVCIGEQRYGLPLDCVERVVPMAHILALPDTGDGLLGMLNLHGQVLPVLDPHPRLGLASPMFSVEQRLVLVRTRQSFLLWVDEVQEVVASTGDAATTVPAQQASPLVPRVLRLGESIVPVLDPAALEPRGSL